MLRRLVESYYEAEDVPAFCATLAGEEKAFLRRSIEEIRPLADPAWATVANRDLGEANIERAWELFALTVLFDFLVRHVAPGAHGARHARVSPAAFADVGQAAGLTRLHEPRFHPLWHEVYAVEQDPDPHAPAQILEEIWPGFALGPLVVFRAGVRVRAGSEVLRQGVADRSTLFWTHTREWRPAMDLSHGWGSNSRWRTCARRDYVLDDTVVYNAGGAGEGCRDGEDNPLAPQLRAELLRHRCLVTSTHGDEANLWPYEDRLVERWARA